MPLLLWLCFSFLYYGFFLPNTAYAKLGAGLPLAEYLFSGLAYTLDFILADPWGALLVFGSAFYIYQALRKPDENLKLTAAIAAGVWCYCSYIVYIGGYQLSLRMYGLPVIAASWLLLWRLPVLTSFQYIAIAVFSAVIAVSISVPSHVRRTIQPIAQSNVSGSYKGVSLFRAHGSAYQINRAVFRKTNGRLPNVKVKGMIGMAGYYNGPMQTYIDPMGLSDPLLARLPSAHPQLIRVGHIKRNIPEGYLFAVEKKSLRRMHPLLANYYRKLRQIIQAPVFSKKRLITLLYFHLGRYDHLKDDYLKSQK